MRNNKGFTLLEVLIVLIIVLVIAFIGTNMLTNSYRSKSRELSWRMASTIKYLYNNAVTENRTTRLVFDFENNTYWAEATTDKFLLDAGEKDPEKEKERAKAKEESAKAGAADAEKKIAAADNADSGGGDGKDKEEATEEPPIEPMEATFGAIETPLIEMRSLPPGILLKDIFTSHDVGPVVAGQAYIYFFQSGYAESAVINFKDEADEKHISIKIDPFTGGADITSEYRTLEEKK